MREGWEYKKLNEVCDKGSSNVVINKLVDNNGDYPLFGASGLVKNVDFFHQDKEYIGIVKDGAGVGRVNTYPAYSSLVGTMQYIFPKEQCLLNYVKYFLVKLDLSHCVSGATIPHIYFKDYGKELIPVPTIEEQQSIVSELDEINNLLSLKRKELETYDKLAQSLFYEMFGDPVQNEKGWEVRKLGEIGEIITGSTPSMKDESNYSSNDYCFVKPSDLPDKGIEYLTSSESFMSEKGFSNSRSLEPGSVLVSCIGSIGKISILKVKAASNQQINAITPFGLVDSVYLAYAIYGMKDYMVHIANAPVVPIINKTTFSKFQIPLPPLSLQQLFAQRIEAIEEQKANVKTAIEKLETLLAARMQYWFD